MRRNCNPVLFFLAGTAMAMALLSTNPLAATAQIPTVTGQKQDSVKTMSQVNVLFVNPNIGDDAGNGGERTPLKTITKALQVANANTVIMLTQGTYSTQTGEIFPLMLKPSVSIQGESNTKGRGIVIQGGGEFLSRTFGRQSVTMVGANSAGLTGVTVTNPNPRGYGLWIEYCSPVVVDNTFTGNTQDGIAVNGDGAPTIRQNYFYRNGANGITIGGNSQPQVRENVFQQTGFGVNITQNAKPLIVSNSIQENRTGIVVQANSHPILRSNRIQDSKEDGLVTLAQSSPDLGNAREPGGNEFRNNGRYDINASAAKQAIAAYGNTLVSNRIAGRVDTNGTTAAIAHKVQSSAVAKEDVGTREGNLRDFNNNSSSRQLNQQQQPAQQSTLPPKLVAVNQKQPSSKASGFPTPTSLAYDRRQTPTPTSQTSASKPSTPQLNYVQISPDTSSNTIEFVAPQQDTRTNSLSLPRLSISASNVTASPRQPISASNVTASPRQRITTSSSLPVLEPAPVGASALLPVPDSNVPLGNTGNMRKVSTPRTTPVEDSKGSLPQIAARTAQIDLRYRVIVEADNEQQQQIVKLIAPAAFQTVWHGRGVMQVGVFSSRYNADNIVRMLNDKGLKAVVEPIN